MRQYEAKMRFRVNDLVVRDGHPNQMGRVEKVRLAAGMVRVRWSKNVASWYPEEDLETASASDQQLQQVNG